MGLANSIANSLYEGMSSKEVEAVFESHGVDYTFISREDAEKYVRPRFSWRVESATGFYGAVIRDVRFRWRVLASEHASIRVEIDAEDKASQIVIDISG